MAVTLIGRNGVHVAALVDKASKNESGRATTQNQPTVADRVAVPVSNPGSVRPDSVQVQAEQAVYEGSERHFFH